MALIFLHDGSINPSTTYVGQPTGALSLPKCDDDFQPNMHSTWPYKHIRKVIKAKAAECCSVQNAALAIDDVVTLALVPAGSSAVHLQWDITSGDPTLQFDLELRKAATPLVAGVAVPSSTGLGEKREDNAVALNTYFSKYGTPCAGKDCFDGSATTTDGKDHGVLVMVIKALPTGVSGGCATSLSRFGTFEGVFDLVVTDLR